MRGFLRLVLILVVVAVGALFLLGYWNGGSFQSAPVVTGIETPQIDTAAARQRGAELGEKAAVAAGRVGEAIEESSLTAKITAKMVLDDLVKARSINVTTNGTTVTLTGEVHSAVERKRAVELAAETEGVTRVVDALVLRQP